MTKVGACTWIYGDTALADVAGMMAEAGLDGVELLGNWQETDPAEARRVLSDHGLDVYSITPADADISHPDDGVRHGAIEAYKRMVDFAAHAGSPILSCHGLVGRIAPIVSQETEDELLVQSVRQICDLAGDAGIKIVWEVLNRYESHQACNAKDALVLLDKVGSDNLSLLLDAYHMNIEEADPADALWQAGPALGLYHAADSNRQALGLGHTDFTAQFGVLDEIGYAGPVILEVCAPGPNPFTPDKGEDFKTIVSQFLRQSAANIRQMRCPQNLKLLTSA